MCGIFGFTGEKVPGLLEAMGGLVRHRGPDDQGSYKGSKVSMGMVRLAIIDLAGGRQPMSSRDGSITVVFNGEIYNYLELKKELESSGHRFRTRSDTETLVHAYEEFGPSFPHRLNGMFAIALWDERKQSLFLIRDRYGVKPLFYASLPEALVFGSEIKAVLRHPQVSGEMDPRAFSHYLSLRNVPAPFTIYRSIRSLCPGQMLTYKEGAIRITPWYQPPLSEEWKDGDEEALVEKIDFLLRDSVRLRLRSDVKYGAYLSGGMDSSMVVALMSEMGREPVKTFALGFEDSPAHKRDAEYARLVAQRFRTEHHEYLMGPGDLAREIPEVVRHLDQPFAGVLSSYWLSRFIKRHVTVALSGDGADDTYGSYGHHRLVWPLAACRRARSGRQDLDSVDFGFFKDRREWVLGLSEKEPWEWRLEYGAFTEEEKRGLLSDLGKDLFGAYSTSEFLKEIYLRSGTVTDDLNRMLRLDQQTLLPNEILYYNDLLSMAHSVEVRTPYLDYRLVELANAIPGTLKIRGGTLKYILRRVAEKYLPKEVLERPKEGFVLPKNTWLRCPLSPFLKEVLAPERLKQHGYFNGTYVESLWKRFQAGEETLTFKVWTLMMFQLWFEGRRKDETCFSAGTPEAIFDKMGGHEKER